MTNHNIINNNFKKNLKIRFYIIMTNLGAVGGHSKCCSLTFDDKENQNWRFLFSAVSNQYFIIFRTLMLTDGVDFKMFHVSTSINADLSVILDQPDK